MNTPTHRHLTNQTIAAPSKEPALHSDSGRSFPVSAKISPPSKARRMDLRRPVPTEKPPIALPMSLEGSHVQFRPEILWDGYSDAPLQPNEAKLIASQRPLVRSDCEGLERPCPWITCRYHLWPEVAFVPRRTRYRKRADAPGPWEMKRTCTLDVAALGGVTLEAVGTILGLTRERVRQIEAHALGKLGKQFTPEDKSDLLHSAWSHG